jgi:polar amino acid transport system substrate-binding protein
VFLPQGVRVVLAKKITGVLAFAFSMSLAATLMAQEVNPTPQLTTNEPPDIARILNRNKLIVAVHKDDGTPFYGYDEQGQLCGIDIVLARGIAHALGVDVEFDRTPATFDGIIDYIAEGKADIAISCISRTPRRALHVSFSTPYVELHHAYLINRVRAGQAGAQPMSQWIDSPDVKIATVEGSSYVDFVQQDFAEAQIVTFPTWDEAAAATVAGTTHVAVYDDSTVMLWLNKHPEEVIYIKARILKDKIDPLSIVVRWQDTHLLSWINDYLAMLEGDGTLDKLREHWLGMKPQKGNSRR